jgi:hypothetical protein
MTMAQGKCWHGSIPALARQRVETTRPLAASLKQILHLERIG